MPIYYQTFFQRIYFPFVHLFEVVTNAILSMHWAIIFFFFLFKSLFTKLTISGQYGQGSLENDVEESKKDAIFYATFSTAPNAIGGSAVCAFRLREVSDAFAGE